MTNGRTVILASIVAGLALILAYFGTAPKRDKQRRSNCYSNLRQIGLGMMQYMNDNDEILPRAWNGRDSGPSDATTNYKWMDAIFPYVKDVRYFTCPNDNVNKPYQYRSGTNYGSYVINNAYFLSGDAQTPPAGARASQIKNWSSTVLVTEGENDFQIAWPDVARTPQIVDGNPFQFGSVRGRHGAGIHVTSLALGADGGCTTAVYNFMQEVKVINGQTIYTAFTIKDD